MSLYKETHFQPGHQFAVLLKDEGYPGENKSISIHFKSCDCPADKLHLHLFSYSYCQPFLDAHNQIMDNQTG